MKYMAHLTGKSVTRIEEVVIFGDSPIVIRSSEDYKDFKSDGYEEDAMFSLDTLSGYESLPDFISRKEGN